MFYTSTKARLALFVQLYGNLDTKEFMGMRNFISYEELDFELPVTFK